MAVSTVSTIRVIGFPPDADMRERRLYCKFLPGFEKAIVSKTNTLFVKFDSTEHAEKAIVILSASPYDPENPTSPAVQAEMANSDMTQQSSSWAGGGAASWKGGDWSSGYAQGGKGAGGASWKGGDWTSGYAQQQGGKGGKGGAYAAWGNGGPSAAWGGGYTQPAPVGAVGSPIVSAAAAPANGYQGQGEGGGWQPNKRPRPDEDPDSIYTIAVLGMDSKGLNPDEVASVMQLLPGFTGLKLVAAINAIFAKFETPELARQAVDIATQNGIAAEMARKNGNF